MRGETHKPTFKELLDRHHISFSQFYETCVTVPTEDIAALYHYDMCLASNLQKMIAHVNTLTQQSYTPEDVHIKQMYGSLEETSKQ